MFENFYSEDIKKQLNACLRVLPHHQNTSGFFITIIEKIAELDGHAPEIAVSDSCVEKIPDVIQNNKPDFKFFRCDKNDPDTQYICAYYGLTAFPVEQLITGSQSEMRKVSYISHQLNRLLLADSRHELNIISTGCEVFARNQAKNS